MPEHPGAGEQMMKCESAVGRGGVGWGGGPHSHTHTELHTPDVIFHKDS